MKHPSKKVELLHISEELEVVEPISITITTEETDCDIVARFPEVEAYGYGTSESEAISMLKDDIISLYEDLNSTPDEQLGIAPLAWKRILNKKIKERV